MKINLLALLLTLTMATVQAHEGDHMNADHTHDGSESGQQEGHDDDLGEDVAEFPATEKIVPNTGRGFGYTWSSSCNDQHKNIGLFVYEAGSVDAENFGYLAALNNGGLCAMVVAIDKREDNANGWDFTTDFMQTILLQARGYVKTQNTTLNFMPIIDPVTDTYL